MYSFSCGNEGINRAESQNMHSSSLAVKAISDAFPLARPRVSHDNERIKCYGHYPILEREGTKFYRYPIASFILSFGESQGWKRAHDFVREVYNAFSPQQLYKVSSKWRIPETAIFWDESGGPRVSGREAPVFSHRRNCLTSGDRILMQAKGRKEK